MNLAKYTQQPIGITMSRQEFTSSIQREVFYLILNQIKKGYNVSYDVYHNLVFHIPARLLKETSYKRIKSSLDEITAIKFHSVTSNLKTIKSIRPFFEASYSREGIQVRLVNQYVEDFVNLSNGYSSYQLDIMLSLNGEYSQRMYEILSGRKNFKNGEWLNVSLDYLKYITCADNCDTGSKFMQRVIKYPQTQFAEKADIQFEVERNKKGKTIESLNFHITEITAKEKVLNKVYTDYDIINGMDSVERAAVYNKLLNEYTFSEEQQLILISDMALFDKFYKINKGIEDGIHTIKTEKTAYMAKSLGFDKKL